MCDYGLEQRGATDLPEVMQMVCTCHIQYGSH